MKNEKSNKKPREIQERCNQLLIKTTKIVEERVHEAINLHLSELKNMSKVDNSKIFEDSFKIIQEADKKSLFSEKNSFSHKSSRSISSVFINPKDSLIVSRKNQNYDTLNSKIME